jgi:hypothetical protein
MTGQSGKPRWSWLYAEAIAYALSFPARSEGRSVWTEISYALLHLQDEAEGL